MSINIRMQHKEVKKLSPKLTVVGVGGAGGNAVNNMITSALDGVEFVICNTDAQAIEGSLCENRVQLGVTVTGGLGAGARPEIGRAAAEESLEEVMQYIDGANMVFITAGMGGGTGTGAAPVIARACRERGILTVGVVTKPFHFEGTPRMKMAEEGISQMQEYVDTLIVIPNQNLFRVANEKTTFAEAFKMADSVLQAGVRGVTDLIINPALINLDFADIRTGMMEMGKAMMGMGEGSGERRAVQAAEAAINNPLLDDVTMKGARGVIVNVTGGADMTLFEVDEACNRIRDEVDPEANIIFGASFDAAMEGAMRVSIIATGIDAVDMVQRKGGNGALSNTMINALTSAQKQEKQMERRGVDRSRPVTQQSLPEPARAPAIPASPAAAAPVRISSAVSSAPINTAATARKLDEEVDLYEQAEFVSAPVQAQAQTQAYGRTQQPTYDNGMRGSRYQDAFIPPAPIEAAQPQMRQPVMQPPAQQQAQQQAPQQMHQSQVPQPTQTYVPAQPAPVSGAGLNLRPPVPGTTTQKKRGQSLFERFTQGLRHEDEDRMVDGNDTSGSSGGSSGDASSGGLRAPSRQTSYQASAPSYQQGSLNIDAPAATRPGPQIEDELDIPAFLRRQAN